jgi:undecaprenyl diphosphate synthase
MDGNRRWARKNGLKSYIGHYHGIEAVKKAISWCLRHKVPYLTLYAFSLENFKRSQDELNYLFNVLAQEISSSNFSDLLKHGIRMRFIGDRRYFPSSIIDKLQEIEHNTAEGTQLFVDILFCYGGQQEIIDATKKLAKQVKDDQLPIDNITESLFEQQLWSHPTPVPDLVIRTGGDKRLSNFLTYKIAYSELLFLDCYWPDLTEQELDKALVEFQKRKRNYGA